MPDDAALSEGCQPFTKRARKRMSTQYGFGHRPTNNWGEGDLPAPFAEGDLLRLDEAFPPDPESGYNRLVTRGMGEPGFYVVCCVFSIDKGDAWYCRVTQGEQGSDRLHVAFAERCSWDEDVNWMFPFTLVDSADPEGLAERERLLAAGWSYTDRWQTCPACGNTTRVEP